MKGDDTGGLFEDPKHRIERERRAVAREALHQMANRQSPLLGLSEDHGNTMSGGAAALMMLGFFGLFGAVMYYSYKQRMYLVQQAGQGNTYARDQLYVDDAVDVAEAVGGIFGRGRGG